tara:strand:- start:55 stop:603 length:549 start_codon:yes stop_codon:yes gene_type:complete
MKSSYKKINTKFSYLEIHEKVCKKCNERKPLREFYMSSLSQDGKTSSCKNCVDKNFDLKQKHKHFAEGESVYFIQDSRNKRVRISAGRNPYLDLHNLQQGSSETLHILASFETSHEESAENIVITLQILFKTHHSGNGWFDMVPSLAQYISLIRNGDSEKAKLLLRPIESHEDKPASKTASK